MEQNQSNQKVKIWNSILILLSVIGLIVCIPVLFPQVRRMIMNLITQAMGRELGMYQSWFDYLLSLAMGGICTILFLDYCFLTNSGRALVKKVKQEIKDCLSEINFRSFLKPVLIIFAIYFLGIFTIIRANFLYNDDVVWSIMGNRDWYNWSRYVIMFLSYFIQPEIHMTDISPIPQLLAILVLACSSVLLVYITGNKKVTVMRLLASIPLGLSHFFLEGLSYKFASIYGAFAILVSIIPFLFVNRKKAFIFCSVLSLLIICMTNQIAVNIYMLIVVILCFQYWITGEKKKKEIFSFLGIAAFAFCFALLFFKFFLMRSYNEMESTYTSTAIYPIASIIPGILSNIKNYALIVNHDLGIVWKVGIVLVLLFFIVQSTARSVHGKISSLLVSVLVVGLSFILSYGLYLLLSVPLYEPRALFGFGALLAILCIMVVSDFKKVATITVLALNWCFFVFAFSYGNALADQGRYLEFRRGILFQDLNVLYSNRNSEYLTFQIKNSIDFTPSVKNIAKNDPIIERLVPKRLTKINCWDQYYFPDYMALDYISSYPSSKDYLDFSTLNLPVVLDSYYHTIQSDGNRVLITLKH